MQGDEAHDLFTVPGSAQLREDIPGTLGAPRSRATGLRHRFGDAVAHAAMHDRALHYRWMRVVHLVDPPAALLRPAMLWRTARANLGARHGS